MIFKKIVIIALTLLLLAGLALLGILIRYNLKADQAQIETAAEDGFPTVPASKNDQGADAAMAKVIYDSDVEWLEEPVKLGDLKLVDYASTTDPTGLPDREYYRVATVKGGGEIIDEFIQPNNPGGRLIMRFHKTAAGKYFLINKNSEFEDDLVNNASVDSLSVFNSLKAPSKITLSGLAFIRKEWSDKMPLDWGELVKLSSTAYGNFYKKLTPADHGLAFAQYVLKLPDSTAMYYDMSLSFLADDNSLIASFTGENEIFAAKKFNVLMSQGCSTPSAVISQSDLSGRLMEIGMTKSGDALYAPEEVSDELFQAVFDDYKIGRPGPTDYNGQPVLTYEEIVAEKPVVVWRDPLGDYHVFYDNNYSRLAECGKPVIYLYPEVETEVRVQVGAKVRVSEPNYGQGWQVKAYPNGKIMNGDGAVYENLYWEGLGRGEYPEIKQGRVVKRENIEAELKHDLVPLGLNEKEAADFMEFWLDKMPATPYIRLTWFSTAEMDALAPLYISPRPDTIARVFLDFAGQATAETDLVPQKLESFKRQGFTVVEWGGLLIGSK